MEWRVTLPRNFHSGEMTGLVGIGSEPDSWIYCLLFLRDIDMAIMQKRHIPGRVMPHIGGQADACHSQPQIVKIRLAWEMVVRQTRGGCLDEDGSLAPTDATQTAWMSPILTG